MKLPATSRKTKSAKPRPLHAAGGRKKKPAKKAEAAMNRPAPIAPIAPIAPATRAAFQEWLAKVACVSEEQATRTLKRIKKDNDFIACNGLQSARDELLADLAGIRAGKIKSAILCLSDGRRFEFRDKEAGAGRSA